MVFNKKKVSEYTISVMELIAKELSKSRLKYICTFLYNILAPNHLLCVPKRLLGQHAISYV